MNYIADTMGTSHLAAMRDARTGPLSLSVAE